MELIDYSIIIIYISLMMFAGLYFKNKASEGIDGYFLGNRKLSWWMLGASGMASNLDISGTMINVALIYVLGVSGFFVELRGGIVLIMAFLMIFMGKWNRRAKVMTLSEWMEFRFGSGIQGRMARMISAIAVLLSTVAIAGYFATGAGKFVGEFLNLPSIWGFSPEFLASFLMVVFAMIYTVASGIYGVVWTDVFQGVLIFISIGGVCFIALTEYSLPAVFTVVTPSVTGGTVLLQNTIKSWSALIPPWELNIPQESTFRIYNFLGVAIIFYMFKTIIEGSSGTGGYMIQRFMAAKNEKEVGKLSLFWTFLLGFRWPFIAAIAIIAISITNSGAVNLTDPERALPAVLAYAIPTGLKGLVIAGLIAAGMSTFDSIINSGASYWVKDIFQAFIKPGASEKELVFQSRLSSVIIVVLGLILTLFIQSINHIWGWLTMSLGSGLIIPLLVRWYWWRLNGYGFSAGIFAGMVAALIQGIFFHDIPEYYSFIIISLSSLAGLLIVTLLSSPVSEFVLHEFYLRTRPFGFWNPVRKSIDSGLILKINQENKLDLITTPIAVIWQLSLFLFLMFLIIQNLSSLIITGSILAISSTLMYFLWFKKLRNLPEPNEND